MYSEVKGMLKLCVLSLQLFFKSVLKEKVYLLIGVGNGNPLQQILAWRIPCTEDGYSPKTNKNIEVGRLEEGSERTTFHCVCFSVICFSFSLSVWHA